MAKKASEQRANFKKHDHHTTKYGRIQLSNLITNFNAGQLKIVAKIGI
jgi:hypothetical protein